MIDSKQRRAWSEAPAASEQIKALRYMAMHSGRTFSVGLTQGQAWSRIARATSLLSLYTRKACAPPWWTPPAAD